MTDEEMLAYKASLPRDLKIPTNERLKSECAEAANVLSAVWDAEVDVLVAMVPKGSKQVTWACSSQDRERLLRILAEIKDSSRFMDMLVKKNRPVK
jgi:hypothetical protein